METIPVLLILLVASTVVFGTAADWCHNDRVSCSGRTIWAIIAGVGSALITLAMVLWQKANVDSARKANIPAAIFLVVWWAFGVGYLTSSSGPFGDLNNGYFSSWIAFIAAVYYAYLAIAVQRGVTFTFGNGAAICLVASIVEFSAATQICRGSADGCTGRWGWAVAVGVISAFICLIQILMHYMANEMAEKSAVLMGALLVLLWAFGAGFNTSAEGPFPYPGSANHANGYFFTWLALFSALYYAANAIPGVREALRTNSGRAEPAWVGHKPRDVEGVPASSARAGGL